MIGIVENIQIGANHNLEEIVSFTYPFKHFHDVFPWSYEEMHGIHRSIVNPENHESPSLGSLNYYNEELSTFFYGMFSRSKN